jgi:hypothetical protein
VVNDLANAIGVSRAAAIGIAILAVVQLALQIFALIDLVRRPAALVRPNKWIWATVILLGSLTGAIVYLAVGRRTQPPAADPIHSKADAQSTGAESRARKAVDLLYGPDNRQ